MADKPEAHPGTEWKRCADLKPGDRIYGGSLGVNDITGVVVEADLKPKTVWLTLEIMDGPSLAGVQRQRPHHDDEFMVFTGLTDAEYDRSDGHA